MLQNIGNSFFVGDAPNGEKPKMTGVGERLSLKNT
jgi:hypothetical protein